MIIHVKLSNKLLCVYWQARNTYLTKDNLSKHENMEKVSAELKEFIIEFCKNYFNTNFHISQLRNDTSIEDDIGITGDDVEIFMNNFSSKFNVNISAFDAKKYFGIESENTDVFWPMVRSLFGNRAWMPLAKEDRSKLTLAMLEKAKEDGVLL